MRCVKNCMKYFDINTKAQKARPHNRLRGLRKRLHDVQVVQNDSIKNGYIGELYGFQVYVSDNIKPGSFYFAPPPIFDRIRYLLGI